jgi:purine-nucleoside phosphorylase
VDFLLARLSNLRQNRVMKAASPQTTAARLKKISPLHPKLAIVLGSGFHHVLTELRVDKKISYAKIPGFPKPTVEGHAGELIFGHLGKTPVLVLSGRAHFYEGHPMERVTFAIRALAAFGVTDLLLTNAAGGINKHFRPGDFMVLTDHINFMGVNPLRGPAILGLNRFVDLTDTYDTDLSVLLFRAGKSCNLRLRRGVYLAVSGPSYETPAEIRAFAKLGADAVGMSTVPEAVAARQCGLNVAAVSCITNPAAGTGTGKLSHAEVLETAARVKTSGAALLTRFAELYGKICISRGVAGHRGIKSLRLCVSVAKLNSEN